MPNTIDNCGEASLCCPSDCTQPEIYLIFCNQTEVLIPIDGTTVSGPADEFFYVYKEPLPGAIEIGARIKSSKDIGGGMFEVVVEGFAMIGGGKLTAYERTLDFNCRADDTYLLGTVGPLDFVSAGINFPVDGIVDIVVTTNPTRPGAVFKQECCQVSILNINGPRTDPDHDRSTTSTLVKNIGSIANTTQQLEITMLLKLSDDGDVQIAYNNYIFELVDIDSTGPPDTTVQDNDMERQTWIQIKNGGQWPGPGPNETFVVKLKLVDNVCPTMVSAQLDKVLEFHIRSGANRRYYDLVEIT